MASMNVRSGDTVEIIVGTVENRGKRGKVLVANPETHTVVVEGLNLVTKHREPRSAQEQGGKFEQPRPVVAKNAVPPSTPAPRRSKQEPPRLKRLPREQEDPKPTLSKEEHHGRKEERCSNEQQTYRM